MECIFCKSKELLIKSKDKAICKSCASTAYYISEYEINQKEETKKTKKILFPKEIKKILNDYVIGQNKAKDILSITIFNHLSRIYNKKVEINKNNLLLIGKSGQGKTLLVQTIAKELDIPLVTINTSSLTSSGYSGDDIDSIIEKLLKKTNNDIKKAEQGIIFLDEIDKIAMSGTSNDTKDVSGKAVQQELLKYLEGDKITVLINKSQNYEGDKVIIDTKNILFIGAGAFPNLDEKDCQINLPGIKKTETHYDLLSKLEKYGFISEFIGRFNHIVRLNTLSKIEYLEILTKPKNNIINKFLNLCKVHNIDLEIDGSIVIEIVNNSINNNIGARSLQMNLDKLFKDFLLNIDKYMNKKYQVYYKHNKINFKLIN